jgi:hypothetical protein
MAQLRGTEQNSSFLADAAWHPDLTREEFYKQYSVNLFGAKAAATMYQAFMTLEENQDYWMSGSPRGGLNTMGCCGVLAEVRLVHDYSLEKNPFDGPTSSAWKAYISRVPDGIQAVNGSIALLNRALERMQAAMPLVEPKGRHELAYLICRTEAYRDDMLAEITEHKALAAVDEAFRNRSTVSRKQFVANLEASLKLFEDACEQAKVATRKYAEIIDHPFDLETLYRLNAATMTGFDLIRQWMRKIANFHEGKEYAEHVPFERVFNGDIQILHVPLRPAQ